jgi:Tol biopolymer transport system component
MTRTHIQIALVAVSMMSLAALGLVGCSPATPSAKVTTSSKPDAAPAGRIVFRQFLDTAQKKGALFVINTDGSNKTQLTKPVDGENDGQPDWSPDGTRIVYAKSTGGGTAAEAHQVEVINADGTGDISLTTAGTADDANFNDQPAFSPDGTEIAYTHGGGNPAAEQLKDTGIFVMNVDGSNQHEVVAMPPYAADVGGVAWSPDGKQLLYGVFNTGSGQPKLGRSFFIINTDGTGITQLTKWDSGSDGTPDWSAKTDTIVFRVAPDEGSGVGNFFTVKPDGSGLTQATHLKEVVASHKVGFSPDGDWIVYGATDSRGITHIQLSKTDGSQARILVGGALDSSAPDWSSVP